jgi:hypothetical protein
MVEKLRRRTVERGEQRREKEEEEDGSMRGTKACFRAR